jgi:hypothetical protein
MITANKTPISVKAGETDTVLQDGAFNDSSDNTTGNQIITGTGFMADGTNGALVAIRVSSVGSPAGMITQLEVQALMNGLAVTVITFPNLAINAVGLYVFEIHPAAGQGNYTASFQGAMPNQFQFLLTLANKDDSIKGSVGVQSTW